MTIHEPDYLLESILRQFDEDRESATRNAFLRMEDRLREAAGLTGEFYGTKLIQKVFHTNDGLLQPYSDAEDERDGLLDLFQGAFKYYRNPLSHRSIASRYTELAYLRPLVEHMFLLIEQAIHNSTGFERYFGMHEGVPLHTKVFRSDIDGDSDPEIIAMIDTSPVTNRSGKRDSHLLLLILDQDSGSYKRIPADPVFGTSMYGPLSVHVEHVTSLVRSDIVATWMSGESGTVTFLMRWTGSRYTPVNMGIVTSSGEVQIKGPRFGLLSREDIRFVDYDGDGLAEIEYITQVPALGIDELSDFTFSDHDWVDKCVVMKWNDSLQILETLSEVFLIR